MKSIKLSLIIASVLVFSGCATSLVEESELNKIKIADTSSLSMFSTCKKLGRVSGTNAGAFGGEEKAIEDLKVSAYEYGANVVVTNMRFKKGMGVMIAADTINGIAFFCPNKVYKKIIAIDELASL